MPTLKRVAAWLMCAVLWPLCVYAQELTDVQLIEMILRDGAQARAIRASVEVTRREQAARTVFPNPGAAYSREGAGFTEFLQVEQPLPMFGTRSALARAGAAATAAAEAERDARLWQLRADAQALVARLLAEQERLDATRANVREIERIIGLLHIREKEGEGSRFDRLRAEQELAEAQQLALDAAASLAEARGSITAALAEGTRITRVIGALYVDRSVPLLDTLLARASSARSDLRALQSASERFRLEASAARRMRLPAPTLVGGMKRAESGDRRESGGLLGVNITVPLFDTGRREAARWLAEQDRVDAERAFIEQRINAQVTAASEVASLRQEAARAIDASTPVDELARIADVAYTEGELRILELLDAHRTVARARIRAIDMRLAARLAQIALERAIGDAIWP
jgi:cobalt-zinc-cadmium efflux system outer membrane protein